MALIDLSRPLRPGLPHWPGDVPFALQPTLRLAAGGSCNLSALTTSLHNGTHLDAPWHYLEGGARIEAVPLEVCWGPAVVIDVRGADAVERKHLAGHDFASSPRVLLRTDAWGDAGQFPAAWPLLAEDVPAWLGARGVCLLGVDVPSVDALDSSELPRHRALAAAGVFILESLDLHGVAAGRYELCALPMRIDGADGSPVRAVLRTVE
jgi:arylformamidase